MRQYTHPQVDPIRLARYYRRFLVSLKLQWMGQGSGSGKLRRRRIRAHMHYRGYVDQYLAGKALFFAVKAGLAAGGGSGHG